MITKHILKLTCGLLAIAGALSARVSSAALYHVDVNTAPLIGNPAGPFSLDFQLNDGSGLGDGNNSVTIGNFVFGTGGPLGSATLLGGAAGDLASGVTLTDTTAFNEFFQSFTAGSTLSFDVSLTANADAGPTPDAFVFGILDYSLGNIPTTGVGDSLLLINISADALNVQTGNSISPAGVVATVPEPSSFVFAGLGLTIACWRARKVARH